MTELEARVLDLLLAGDDPALAILREQRAGARVRGREHSDAGYLVFFEPPARAPLVEPSSFALRDVWFHLAGCGSPGAAILFVREGRIDTLELYNWHEPWPRASALEDAGYLRAEPEPGAEPSRLVETGERDPGYLEFQIRGSAGRRDRPREG